LERETFFEKTRMANPNSIAIIPSQGYDTAPILRALAMFHKFGEGPLMRIKKTDLKKQFKKAL